MGIAALGPDVPSSNTMSDLHKRSGLHSKTDVAGLVISLIVIAAVLLLCLLIAPINVFQLLHLYRQGYAWPDCMHVASSSYPSEAAHRLRILRERGPPPPHEPPCPSAAWRARVRPWRATPCTCAEDRRRREVRVAGALRAVDPAHTREHIVVRARDSEETLPVYKASDSRDVLPKYELEERG